VPTLPARTIFRVIAVDWSGARKRAKRKIWRAEFLDAVPTAPEGDLDREEIADYLIQAKSTSRTMFVGLDFAFSYPEWYIRELGCSSAPEFWRVAKAQGEQWLKACPTPFWGRRSTTRPGPNCEIFRYTERNQESIGGIRPKSVFQVSGPGHVGTGSLRGMPALLKLRDAGFAIWPFDPPNSHMVVEIYPRLLTKEVHKGNKNHRERYLSAAPFSAFGAGWTGAASSSEDAFDAAISAVCMQEHLDELQSLPATTIQEQIEGKIWLPRSTLLPVDRSPARR
jgi:hypothetical protein